MTYEVAIAGGGTAGMPEVPRVNTNLATAAVAERVAEQLASGG